MTDRLDDVHVAIGAGWEARLRDADPLLPPFDRLVASCGARFAVAGRDGQATAVAGCAHREAKPGSLDRTWSAARRFSLTVRIAGGDVPGALDALLAQWREHLAAEPGADDADSAAAVTWPSRDVTGIRTLQRHGLIPMAVVAARLAGRPGQAPATGQAGAGLPAPAGLRIRRAGPADLGEVTRLGMELVRYDAHFGSVSERPESAAAMRAEVAVMLGEPEPWTWLAERDGRAVGLVAAERPEAATWIAPLSRHAPVAYLLMGYVDPAERAGGIGAALTARLHAEADAAGVAVTLLHYSQVNPLSAPFWSQQGYRPLWTSWEAWPASAMR